MSVSPPPAAISKQDLKRLVAEAGTGNPQKIERLISPFLTSGERLMWCGISGKIGLFPTYDFAFVTDRRIGDLEINPLTGHVNVEVCYLQHIDACAVIQPAFPIWMWGILAAMYPIAWYAVSLGLWMFATFLRELELYTIYQYFPWMLVRFGLRIALLASVYAIINPGLKRFYLRFKKSGLWLKLRGGSQGTFIFADRDKFSLLATMTRVITEQKRQLDKETQ
jgi:hypothetical protein